MDDKALALRKRARGFAIATFVCQIAFAIAIVFMDAFYDDYFGWDFRSIGELYERPLGVCFGILFVAQLLLFICNIKCLKKPEIPRNDSIGFLVYFGVSQLILAIGMMGAASNYGEGFFEMLAVLAGYALVFVPCLIILIIMLAYTDGTNEKSRNSLKVCAGVYCFLMVTSFYNSGVTFFAVGYLKSTPFDLLMLATNVLLFFSYTSFLDCTVIKEINNTNSDEIKEEKDG